MTATKPSRTVACIAVALLTGLAAPAAFADRDDDDHRGRGHGHGHDRHEHKHKHKHGHKEVFWDGNCKVERKWERDGDFKEKRECKAPERRVVVVQPPPPQRVIVVQPPPPPRVVVQPAAVVYPPWVVVEQGRPYRYKSGYEPVPVAQGRVVNRCNSDAVGAVLGGFTGAALGSQVGGGSGRVAATIGGAVAGVLVGGEIGRRIDAGNQACIGQALEMAPAGQRVEWPSGKQQYAVVPGAVVQRNGQYCRPYSAEVRTNGGWESIRGTACRRPDGTWQQVG
jgi:surface antigen